MVFTAGAIVGASASRVLSHEPLPQLPPPPLPPPMPPRRKVFKARIFYRMKELPLGPDGEDTRGRQQQQQAIVMDDRTRTTDSNIMKVTECDLRCVKLRAAPPLLTLEQKRSSFFEPPRPLMAEILQRAAGEEPRLHRLQPQTTQVAHLPHL